MGAIQQQAQIEGAQSQAAAMDERDQAKQGGEAPVAPATTAALGATAAKSEVSTSSGVMVGVRPALVQ